ncbi:MAG TPA: FmdE family protein [Pyrinomonadaceae bacterium]|nr:FmdE family protein [Pyrinomonadaceae bacterium]
MSQASLDELLGECEKLHGHLCPGQLLGVRMALLGCDLVGVEDPRGADRKKLIVWVEIDRCMADAVSAVTGARLGRRSLKFRDYGKVAATFLNVAENRAVRVVAREESRGLAERRFPELESKKERQMRAYREASAEELFKVEQVSVTLGETDLPGRPRGRVLCDACSEGINDGREVLREDGRTLCRPCATGGYYQRGAGTVRTA